MNYLEEYNQRYERVIRTIQQQSRRMFVDIENQYDMIDDLFHSNQRLLNMMETSEIPPNNITKKLKEEQNELKLINNQLVEEMIEMNKQLMKSHNNKNNVEIKHYDIQR